MRKLIDRIGYVPRNCVWELTRACNLRCAHCGTGAGRPRQAELSTMECIDVAHQLAALGTRLITLSGGEPTVRRDWPLIARAAVSRGVVVNMVTNGQSDPRQLARDVRAAGLCNVGVSIDGLEQTHDAIRREGAFARATETVSTLAAAGIWVDVMLTVNRMNLRQIDEVYQLAWRLGAAGFRTQLGKPMGNQTHREDLTLAPRHLLTLLPTLGRLARSPGPVINVGDSIGYFSSHEQVLRGHRCSQGHWTGCYAGCQAIGIQADGGIKGCLSLQPREGEEDRFLEGSLRDSSLAHLWYREGAFAYNRHFSPDQLKGACADCSYGEICRGGATCVSYTFTGELGCDPMCYHRAALDEATGARRRRWSHAASAAAAAMLLALGGAGCSAMHTSPGEDAGTDADADADQGDPGPDTDADVDADADGDAAADGDAEPADGDIDAEAEGDAEPDGDVDAQPECSELDCTCFVCNDYGDPWSGCSPCGPIETFQACCCDEVTCVDLDYGDPCPGCDYGEPVPDYWRRACCEPPPSNDGDYGLPDPPPEK